MDTQTDPDVIELDADHIGIILDLENLQPAIDALPEGMSEREILAMLCVILEGYLLAHGKGDVALRLVAMAGLNIAAKMEMMEGKRDG